MPGKSAAKKHEEARAACLREFGARVKSRRENLGLSQEALAERTGLHRTYIASIEMGIRNVGIANLFALQQALGAADGSLVAGLTLAAKPPARRPG